MENTKLEKYLNQKGFNLVELPREDINIFDVLHEEDRSKIEKVKDKIFNNSFFVNYLGEIDVFFETDMSLPVKFDQNKYKKWADATVIEREAGLSFSFLTNIINGINGKINTGILFKQTEKVKLDFNDVIIEKYSKELLGQYINKGKLKRGIHHIDNFKNGQIYIIYELAKCKSISLEFYNKHDDIIELSGTIENNMLEAGATAKNLSEDKTNITFEGDNMLVFGFKALQLNYKSTHYKISKEKHQTLKETGIPEYIYDLIYPITNKIFNTEQEFSDEIKKWLPEIDFKNYKHIFLNFCIFDKFETKNVIIKHRDADDDKLAQEVVFISYNKNTDSN